MLTQIIKCDGCGQEIPTIDRSALTDGTYRELFEHGIRAGATHLQIRVTTSIRVTSYQQHPHERSMAIDGSEGELPVFFDACARCAETLTVAQLVAKKPPY